MKDIQRKNLKKEYPQMPDSFHQALLQEIEYQTETIVPEEKRLYQETHPKKKRKPFTKLIAIAATMILLGATVFAAQKCNLMELWPFHLENINQLQIKPETTQPDKIHFSTGMKENTEQVNSWPELPDSSPLLDIQETLFDGVRLYVLATPTENGKKYDLHTDRLYINDMETLAGTSYYNKGEVLDGKKLEQEIYTFEADLYDLHLKDAFEVTLPLSVYEKTGEYEKTEPLSSTPTPVRYQNQDLSFQVNEIPAMIQCPAQTFTYDDFTLESTNMKISDTTIKANFYYHLSPELLNTCQASEKILLPPVIFGENGTECKAISISSIQKNDGTLFNVEYYNSGVSLSEQSCTVQTRIRDYATGEEYEIAAESTVALK